VIGAGIAGLAAATALTERGFPVVLHEATAQAGGRCRSYFDPTLGRLIDNGNHLLLSGNRATLEFLERIGGRDKLAGPKEARFAFADLKTGERWELRLDRGRLPFGVFDSTRRVPGTRASDYLRILRVFFAGRRARLGDILGEGRLAHRLWRPVMLAALNTEPESAAAPLAAAVLRETFLRGGAACRPLIAATGLAAAFVDPALAYLSALGEGLRFSHRLQRLHFGKERVEALEFAEGDVIPLERGDHVLLAAPPWVAADLVPGLKTPVSFRGILNAHYGATAPSTFPRMIGVINGLAEWIFCFADRIAVTVSAADRLMDVPREELARQIWQEVATLTGLAPGLPPWQIVKERRATIAATAENEARRPPKETAWNNLLLAGDWIGTGLPATIESAVRAGEAAARLIMARRLEG
jgi:squalene-associated FAD-dependent desaturase